MDNPPNVDFIYWTFTAAAQSVAAFVGLLLAGYALVHSLMESARERDDSLDEIHLSLRRTYHRWLRLLAVLTGLAIVLSLGVVITNKWEFPGKYAIAAVVGLLDIASVVCGLGFVVVTTHPKRYELTAERVLEQRGAELALSGETLPVSKFFAQITRLERLVQKLAEAWDVGVNPPPGRPATLRHYAEALLDAERIDNELYRELGVILQYRNLVFHGHVKTADKTMFERVVAVIRKVEKLREAEGVRGPATASHAGEDRQAREAARNAAREAREARAARRAQAALARARSEDTPGRP